MYRIDHWIDGHAVSSKSGRTGNIFDPATGQVQGTVGFADVDEVDQAVADLAKAQWRLNNCVIVAPVSGVILTKKSEEGNIINPEGRSVKFEHVKFVPTTTRALMCLH